MGLFSVCRPWRGTLAGALLFVVGCGDESSQSGQDDDGGGNGDAGAEMTTDARVGSDARVGADASEAEEDAGSSDAGASVGDGGQTDDAAVDDTPIAGDIQLTVVPNNAGANAVAALVGMYEGNLGIWAPVDGKPERYSGSCTITVAADGTLSVRASESEVSSVLNGNDLDTVMSPNRDQLSRSANAFDVVGNESHSATVTVIRGYVTSAVGTVRTLQNQAVNTVTCYVRNPNPRMARAGTGVEGSDLSYGGATAADLNHDWFGTYSNGTCSVTIGEDGTLHLTKGSVDMSTRLAGDEGSEWGDSLAVLPFSTELNAGELLTDGTKNSVRLRKSGESWEGFARNAPDVLVSFSDCKSLVKQ